jgi:DNA polymerase-3 subunit beta
MKLTCLQENLNRGLSIVSRAAATRTTLPITSNVLITTDNGRLRLSTTNLELAISCWIGANIEDEGEITIPARLISDFVASLPNDKIEISLASRSKTLKIKCARFEARISGVDAKEFPPIPKIEEVVSIKVNIRDFSKAIEHVVFAAAVDESRPVLTGIDTNFEGEELTLAAADGFRLAVYTMPLSKKFPNPTKVIIPARTLAEVNRLTGSEEESVEIGVDTNKSQILFKLSNIEVVSQLIQGSFPQYKQLIPQAYGTRAVVDVAHFAMATKTASIFARDGGGIVRLTITPGPSAKPGRLTVSSRSEEIGDDVGDIDADVQGEEAKIAFNSRYLADVLSIIKEPQVALEISTPSSPGVIRPVGIDNYTHVIMPMFVQW